MPSGSMSNLPPSATLAFPAMAMARWLYLVLLPLLPPMIWSAQMLPAVTEGASEASMGC